MSKERDEVAAILSHLEDKEAITLAVFWLLKVAHDNRSENPKYMEPSTLAHSIANMLTKYGFGRVSS